MKNFGPEMTDDSLKALFAPFGPISSCVIMKSKDEEGNEKSRGFGFVDFEKHEDAVKAVDALNGYQLPGTDLKLYVSRFQTKAEQFALQKAAYEQKKLRYQSANL